MSQENVEIVRRTLDALDRRDFQSAMCGFHIDAVWHNTGEFPGERICVGPQAIVDFWEALLEPFQNESREVERLVESEDVVVLSLRSVARGRTSGVPLDVRWGAAFQLRDGKIIRVDVRGSFDKALEAAGLAE